MQQQQQQQQGDDGASPFKGRVTEEKLNAAGKAGGWNIQPVTQPAKLPDLNINDLGSMHLIKVGSGGSAWHN